VATRGGEHGEKMAKNGGHTIEHWPLGDKYHSLQGYYIMLILSGGMRFAKSFIY
jgi:hypothetical protein